MIKKSVFEEELIAGMHQQLIKQATQRDFDHVEKAVEYLNSAAEIFEDMGMIKNSDAILSILYKIAHNESSSPGNHTKGLTSDKMTSNLKEQGVVFNMVNDNLLDIDVNDAIEIEDGQQDIHDFEDEKDSVRTASESFDRAPESHEALTHEKKERFVKQVIKALVQDSDDFDWAYVKWYHLAPMIDFNISVDDNMFRINRQGLTPDSFKVLG